MIDDDLGDEDGAEGEAAPGSLAAPALADGLGAAAGYYASGAGVAALGTAAAPYVRQ